MTAERLRFLFAARLIVGFEYETDARRFSDAIRGGARAG
jgi:hypothetical protein